MSFKAMSWAASTKTHTPIQKLILLLLADRANDEGFCFPSMKTIAEDACMSRSAVMENVKKLAAQGLINVTKRTITDEETGRARNTSNLYHLNTGVVVLPDGGSRLERLGVVAQDDNSNLSIEPINKPIESEEKKKQDNRTDSGQNKCNKKPSSPKDNGRFEKAWAAYGRKGNKQTALRYWSKLTSEDKDGIMEKMPAYLRSRDKCYLKDFQGWINPRNRMWEDEVVLKGATKVGEYRI